MADAQMREAAQILKSGGLVCFPTETVYGLGANALLKDSVDKIFKAKGRPSDNPLIVHIADFEALKDLTPKITESGRLLMERFWPGPLTLLFQKSDLIPSNVTANLNTVGIRMPNHDIARRLIRLSGVPVCAPSANLSTKPSPTEFSHAFFDLDGKIDAIIDGGPCNVGVESTVVDVSEGGCEILRPGGITLEQLRKVIPKATVFQRKGNEKPKSPGMKYKHYSPKAEIYVISGNQEEVAKYINQNYDNSSVILAFSQNSGDYADKRVWSLGDKQDLSQAARCLFHHFREADKQGITAIYCEDIDTDAGMGLAVRNRLYKASKEVIRL